MFFVFLIFCQMKTCSNLYKPYWSLLYDFIRVNLVFLIQFFYGRYSKRYVYFFCFFQARRMMAKLDIYRKFTNALVVAVIVSVGWICYEVQSTCNFHESTSQKFFFIFLILIVMKYNSFIHFNKRPSLKCKVVCYCFVLHCCMSRNP